MFDWKELQLQKEQHKEQNWHAIEQRLQRKKQPNALPMLVGALLCLVLFLWIVTEPGQQVQGTAQIEQMYAMEGEGAPSSSWQMRVKKIQNEELLAAYEQLFTTMQPITKQLAAEPTFTVGVQRAGQMHYYALYEQSAGVLVRDAAGNVYVSASEQIIWPTYNELHDFEKSSRVMVLLLVWLVVQIILEKKLIPVEASGHKAPRHSHIAQTIIDIVMAVLMVSCLLWVQQMHLVLLFSIPIIAVVLKIGIEQKTANASWRKILFVSYAMYVIIWTMYVALI